MVVKTSTPNVEIVVVVVRAMLELRLVDRGEGRVAVGWGVEGW